MATDKTVYLVQGGLNLSKDSKPDFDFFIITYDFKKNYGYIGKKGKNSWKLYTILGKTPMVLGSPDNHYFFKSFEDCVHQLEKLAEANVKTQYIEVANDLKNETTDLKNFGDGNLYGSDKTINELLSTRKLVLTPGATYKLELYFEYLKRPNAAPFTDYVHNGMTFHLITERHKQRIKILEQQLENEKYIIRPEDIPDFDIE